MDLERNSVLRLLLLAALTFCAAPLLAQRWVKALETDGLMALVIAPSEPSRVYAVQRGSRLLISDDGGRTWRQSAPVVSFGGPTSITVDPHDAQTIYVGTSGGVGLYKSVDGGGTFSPLGGGQFAVGHPLVVIDPQNSSVVYASRTPLCTPDACKVAGGILKSEDGGASWHETARIDSSTVSMAIDPTNPRIVYSCGYGTPKFDEIGGLYRTTDGGATWPAMFPGYASLRQIATDMRGRVYVINAYRFDQTLFRSDDHGVTATLLSPPEGVFIHRVVAHPLRPTTIYISTPTGIQASYDDGATWSALPALMERNVPFIDVASDGTLLAGSESAIYRYEPAPPRARAVRR